MDRQLNYIFSFVLVVLFTMVTGVDQHWQIICGVILALIFSFLAFISLSLTLDGMVAATIIGTYIYGFGGVGAAIIVLLFFVSCMFLAQRVYQNDLEQAHKTRRDGLQVWANGFWPAFLLSFYACYHSDIFLIAALASVATATADTWATELKSRKEGDTYLITDFNRVPYGTDGGVSLKGTAAGFMGSIVIGVFAAFLFSLPVYGFIFISIAGFVGCIADSLLGAKYQGQQLSTSMLQTSFYVDNNIVNLISTGAGAVLVIIFKVLFI